MIIQEKHRIEQKGYWFLIAIFINVMLFCIAPIVGRIGWPYVLQLMTLFELEEWSTFIVLSTVLTSLFVFIQNIIQYILHTNEFPFFEQFKIVPEEWPWKQNRQEWDKLLRKTVMLVTFNNLVLVPLSFLTLIYFQNWDCHLSFEIEKLPDTKTLFFQVIFCMFWEDFTFHFTHRALHQPFFYKHVHKVHHSHIIPVGIASEYAHPIEFIFGNLLPLHFGAFLLGKQMHFFAYMVWGLVRLGETVDDHCGYEFPWSPFRVIPFSASSSYHTYHHYQNVGNYSTFFSIWDTVFGTNKSYFQYQERIYQEQTKKEK